MNPDYTYSFRERKGRQVLVIEDTSPTGFFVEDNLDNVVKSVLDIEDVVGPVPYKFKIVNIENLHSIPVNA